jgi:hypothetical protein
MLRTIFLDMTAIFHKLPAIGAHLKYNDIDIKLVSLLSAAQNIISFLLMIIPLKILLFIISDDINFALFSEHIDKYVYLSLLIVVFAFFAITFEAIKARIKSVKYQLSLKYRNIDRKRDFYRDNFYVVPIIDHMINFHASLILFTLYFTTALLISLTSGFLYALIVVIFSLIFFRVKDNSSQKRLSSFFYFRITSIILTLIFIVTLLSETNIFLSLALFFVTRQWLTQITQIGSGLVKLDSMEMPRVVITQKLDTQKISNHKTFMKKYFNDELKHNIIDLIKKRIEGKHVEPNEFKFRYLDTPIGSIDTFYLQGPKNDLIPNSNLVVYYNHLNLFLTELELQPVFRSSTLTCDTKIVQHRDVNGVVFKDVIEGGFSKNSFAEFIPQILLELWRVSPEHFTLNGIGGGYVERNLNKNIVEDVILIAENEEERAIINGLAQKTDLIVKQISNLPQVFLHPFFSSSVFFQDKKHAPKMFGLGYMELAPVGAQLAFVEENFSPTELEAILKQLLPIRPEFSNVSPNDLLLSKAAYQFVRAYKRRQYFNAKREAIRLAEVLKTYEA